VMEAMKMETPVTTDRGGRIHFTASPGDYCTAGTELARVLP
jgi:biotin carboxyl carrier protein